MCTVTVLNLSHAARPFPRLRMLVNRDESRRRPEARGPEIRDASGVAVLMPVDPQSDGTWVAVNAYGVMFTLLNYNPTPYDRGFPRGERSRGEIIPMLADACDVSAALPRAKAIKAAEYAPFRLAIFDHASFLIAIGERGETRVTTGPLAPTTLLASSGLGDALVEAPRGLLFDETFQADDCEPSKLIAAQDAYHRHTWPDREHLSVWMSRAEAWTTGLTVVESQTDVVRLAYASRADVERGSPLRELTIPRQSANCATGR
ncbi:MAG: NRDE family protein [Phycisphaerales bacterium]|nr:NRDE family protein [Phycisphaerales bacterium]